MAETDKTSVFSAAEAPGKLKSFAAGEMIACEACLRTNPPTRTNCLYCGVNLPAATRVAETAHPSEVAQPPADAADEPSDVTYLVLASSDANQVSPSSLSEVAMIARLKEADLKAAIEAGGSLPLVQPKNDREAAELSELIQSFGHSIVSIRHEALAELPEAKGIRSLEFSDDSLAGVTPSPVETISHAWQDLILIVAGRFETRNQQVVERQRRGQIRPIDSTELAADEPLMDLYFRSTAVAWRIFLNSFDFSCLGSNKRATAFENTGVLVETLRARAPNLQFNDSYVRLRPLLAIVWPLEKNSGKAERRRVAFSRKINLSTVTTINNEAQFNNYSRMLYHLRLRDFAAAQ